MVRDLFTATRRQHYADAGGSHKARNNESDAPANHPSASRRQHGHANVDDIVARQQAASVQSLRQSSVVGEQLLRAHEAPLGDEAVSM